MRGHSLDGLAHDGQIVHLLRSFYACHELRRDELIAYRYAGHEMPLVKVVKGLPGDRFSLEQAKEGWHLRVNDTLLKNSDGKLYLLNDNAKRMLSLYEKDFRGLIPPDAYLILGNLPNGTLDSSRFGLVHKSDIIGKIVLE